MKINDLINKLLILSASHFLNKTNPRVIVVVGSVGKTSTTQSIATVLSQQYSVRKTRQNYNTVTGVVASIFDLNLASSIEGWLKFVVSVFIKSAITKPKFEILVLELGTDRPGDIGMFKFLSPELAIITAVTPEHMEYFRTLDAVAKEELSVLDFSKVGLVNKDMIDERYLEGLSTLSCQSQQITESKTTKSVEIKLKTMIIKCDKVQVVGKQGRQALLIAANVGELLSMPEEAISAGIQAVVPEPGRMQKLNGVNGTIIIDDTYNSSPEAVRAALDYLYSQSSSSKIAILGMMNEMGADSERLHRQVGSWCDPKQISLLVTLGEDANKYLADEAEKVGCLVFRASSPEQAGQHVLNILSRDTVVLVKGSQNGVYAEEAVKVLLANPADAQKLVRQTDYWPKKKGDFYVSLP